MSKKKYNVFNTMLRPFYFSASMKQGKKEGNEKDLDAWNGERDRLIKGAIWSHFGSESMYWEP